MPRVLFPNIPIRMVLQPRNKLAQNLRGAGALADPTDPRREGAWSKVVVHAPPSTNKFEIEQYLSKIYNVDVKKVRTTEPRRSHPPISEHPRSQAWLSPDLLLNAARPFRHRARAPAGEHLECGRADRAAHQRSQNV
jgi:hypothetical protein